MGDSGRIDIPLLTGAFNRPETIRSRAQILFLSIVAAKTPAPFLALRDEILPRYRAAFKVEKERGVSDAETSTLSSHALVDLMYGGLLKDADLPKEVRESRKRHPLLYAAGQELLRWSERFNLRARKRSVADRIEADSDFFDDYWPIATAFQSIIFWHFDPKGPLWEIRAALCPPLFRLNAELRAHQPAPEILPPIRLRASAVIPDANVFKEIDAPGWYVELEKETEFRKRMGEAFDTWLGSYIDEREKSALAAGLVPNPDKRKLVLQFTWLARYQIEKTSSANLAREYRRKPATVDDGIDAALELIHLEKRAAERGGAKGDKHPKRRR